MKDKSEFTILKEGNIKITNRRVIIGLKTYAMSNITSARVRTNEPKSFIPVFVMVVAGICSVLVALVDMQEYSHFMTVSLYLGIGVVLFFLLSRKTKYSVRVRGSMGELTIFEANDRDYAERILGAMNEAIRLQSLYAQAESAMLLSSGIKQGQ
jgi:Na+-translocating ferredoxin:NAD+ oxidoreductase RnfE subunit